MSRTRSAAALAGALALALAGCASPGGAEPGTTDSSAPSSATPSQTPATPPPTPSTPGRDEEDPADPATWEIEDGSIGPVELGEPFAQTLAGLPAEWINDDSCAWVAYWSSPDGTYLVSFQRDADAGADGPVVGVAVEWLSDMTGIGPRTEEGLGVGAQRDDVLAVFPDAEEVASPVDGVSHLRVRDDDAEDGALFFTYSDGGDGAGSVTVTTQETPSYEACA
ncbi:hypothetical protein [Microbacterium gilvum]|uniref:Lipoprotein n=1 Tax=Microbacterium gilvum TaxID=1336204 RepID=A0ABP9ADJ8_9MICO